MFAFLEKRQILFSLASSPFVPDKTPPLPQILSSFDCPGEYPEPPAPPATMILVFMLSFFSRISDAPPPEHATNPPFHPFPPPPKTVEVAVLFVVAQIPFAPTKK